MSGRSALASWLSSPPPSVALEIGARRVTAVALGTVAGRLTVTAHATERLPDGAVAPALTTPNVVDREAVAAAVRKVLDALGTRATRVALVIPDGAAKVSLVRFDRLPERTADLDQLVRWQVKKAVPFPLEQAQVSWTTGIRDASGVELVVTIARRDIVVEYEQVCEAAKVHPGIVDLATFTIVNLVLAGDAGAQGGSGDWLLVHVSPDSSTMAIVRGDALVLFRNRPTEGEGSLADLVHQTTMYYEDRLGGQALGRVIVAPRDLTGPQADELASMVRALEQRAGVRVQEVDLRTAAGVSDRLAPAPDLLRALAAPVGVLMRERVA
jgi:type IV pilus assembly protein PilM